MCFPPRRPHLKSWDAEWYGEDDVSGNFFSGPKECDQQFLVSEQQEQLDYEFDKGCSRRKRRLHYHLTKGYLGGAYASSRANMVPGQEAVLLVKSDDIPDPVGVWPDSRIRWRKISVACWQTKHRDP